VFLLGFLSHACTVGPTVLSGIDRDQGSGSETAFRTDVVQMHRHPGKHRL